ncbi:hypothetical protein MCOR05_008693 [Pyricularia oryzae]|nr:hypothetical protein MCOR05_008693 [Pyricularia oryzae]
MALSNAKLIETPLASVDYNLLPHIDEMRDAAAQNARAHAILLGTIAAHGLSAIFSVHLVHRHFNIPEGHVMVYQKGKEPDHGEFILCSPRTPEATNKMRGLYFRALSDGNMAAYEFTTEPGQDLSAHEKFVEIFARTVVDLGVQDIFALTVVGIVDINRVLTEFEMVSILSTILVYNAAWLPDYDAERATSTDWVASRDYAQKLAQNSGGEVPGIITLKCTKTRSNTHYNVTCSKTRGGSHYEQKPAVPQPEAMESGNGHGNFYIGGKRVAEGSEGYAVMSMAMRMVEAF